MFLILISNMCGFLGEYSFDSELSNKESFSHLLSLSKHRGPDSSNVVKCENFQLGFNRLALLDLSEAGQQPKQSPSTRFDMVFNGEVYNYLELSEQYKLKKLRSTSDTEVILHLFDEIGVINTLKELNGMFAIAVIDNEASQLYLSRDFAGIKPLFYGINQKGVVFASQFDQIFKHDWFSSDLELRKDAVSEYFMFGYMQAPNTVYKNIYQVNPGECLVIKNNCIFKKISICKFSKDFRHSKKNAGIKQDLSHAVDLQLNCDRSLASFLSGGIDSSLISALAKLKKNDLEAFTVEVDDEKFNEAEFARTYASHLDIKHQVETIKPGEFVNKVYEHFDSFSEPFGDYSSLPTYLVTKKAARYHTAMLSGDGGDELFFGYPRMYDLLQKRNWFRLNIHVRKLLVRITNKLGITDTYAPFAESLEEFWMAKHMKLPSKLMSSCFENEIVTEDMRDLYRINSNLAKDQLQHFLRWNEFYAHMQRTLIKVDRTSMRNSLEVRVPLLDKSLISNAWKILPDISNMENLKKPLKEIVYQFIPKNLMLKQKKGFSVPLKDWLRGALRNDLENVILKQPFYGTDVFDAEPLKMYVIDFLEGKHNNEWGVWHIYAWQKWAVSQKLI